MSKAYSVVGNFLKYVLGGILVSGTGKVIQEVAKKKLGHITYARDTGQRPTTKFKFKPFNF